MFSLSELEPYTSKSQGSTRESTQATKRRKTGKDRFIPNKSADNLHLDRLKEQIEEEGTPYQQKLSKALFTDYGKRIVPPDFSLPDSCLKGRVHPWRISSCWKVLDLPGYRNDSDQNNVQWGPNNDVFISAGERGSHGLYRYDVINDESRKLTKCPGYVRALTLSKDGNTLGYAYDRDRIGGLARCVLWDVEYNKNKYAFRAVAGKVNDLVSHEFLLMYGCDRGWSVCDTRMERSSFSDISIPGGVCGLQVSSDGKNIACGYRKNQLAVSEMGYYQQPKLSMMTSFAVKALALSPDGRKLAYGGEKIGVVRLRDGSEQSVDVSSPVNALSWREGEPVISGDEHGVKGLHPVRLDPLEKESGHNEMGGVIALASSPIDGKFCGTTDGGRLQFWEVIKQGKRRLEERNKKNMWPQLQASMIR